MCQIIVKLLVVFVFIINVIDGFNVGDTDGIVFPEEHSYKTDSTDPYSKLPTKIRQQISNLYNIIDQAESIDEIEHLLNITHENRFPGIERRLGVQTPQLAKCKPSPQVVPLFHNLTDPTVIYIPYCTRVNRCGGCCDPYLRVCEPIKTEMVNYEVKVFSAMDSDFIQQESEIVAVEVHKSCNCKCKIKEVCPPNKTFSNKNCRCECLNSDEEKKCFRDTDRVWNFDFCACTCRLDRSTCASGYIFNENACRCELSSRRGNWDPSIAIQSSVPERHHKDEPRNDY